MLFSSRWCPLDDLTASTLLINIPRIIFLHFQGDLHCQVKPTMSQIHRPIWLFQAQTLTSNPSQLLAPAVFTIWSEDFSQPRQVLWAGIINLIQFQACPVDIVHILLILKNYILLSWYQILLSSRQCPLPRRPYSLNFVGRHFQNYLSTLKNIEEGLS